jgi:hypothetical protein
MAMGALEYVIRLAVDAAPQYPGLQIQPLYLVLNLTLPFFLGILLTWITRFMEKGLTRLLGEKS